MQQGQGSNRERSNLKGMRLLVLILALSVTVGLGLITPGSQATFMSRLIVFTFTFFIALSLVTIIALIPSPPDPRERARRIFQGLERAEIDDTAPDVPEPEKPGDLPSGRQYEPTNRQSRDG